MLVKGVTDTSMIKWVDKIALHCIYKSVHGLPILQGYRYREIERNMKMYDYFVMKI